MIETNVQLKELEGIIDERNGSINTNLNANKDRQKTFSSLIW